MAMVRMITTAEHQYAGRRLRAGQRYDCEPQHVALMRRLGWARPVEKEKEEEELTYQTRHLEAEAPKRARRRRK